MKWASHTRSQLILKVGVEADVCLCDDIDVSKVKFSLCTSPQRLVYLNLKLRRAGTAAAL